MPDPQPLLEVNQLTVGFHTDRGDVTAIEDISFQLMPGEILGIVGESGCGKSVTTKSIMQLLPKYNSFVSDESEILFEGQNLCRLNEREMRAIRGNRIAMIFQEPMTALNPVFSIGWQLDEALKYHTTLNREERKQRVIEMLEAVEIPNPEKRYREFPNQLSGGMRQRVMIAIALCCEPEILLADEPTTALDVTIQAQILRLMDRLRQKTETAIILVTHDLGVVAQVCDRVIVMYAGQIVEVASVEDLFHAPAHPYPKALLDSMPKPGAAHFQTRLPAIDGMVPSLFNLPSGCRFHDRCSRKQDRCVAQLPVLGPVSQATSQADRPHDVRCFFPNDP